MKIYRFLTIFMLCSVSIIAGQGGYTFRTVELPGTTIQSDVIGLNYPVTVEGVQSLGMGGAQVAAAVSSSGMLVNPAFLSDPVNRFVYSTVRHANRIVGSESHSRADA
ncbi:MAG: hypothetical protein U5R06_03090 [candidate division KSB1 bacterium]|nr:hypothetical protein [candidate division KSB1 bacterium]